MTKTNDQTSQHSMHGGRADSKSNAAPASAGKPKAPSLETKSSKPVKSAASNDDHSGHSPTLKSR